MNDVHTHASDLNNVQANFWTSFTQLREQPAPRARQVCRGTK